MSTDDSWRTRSACLAFHPDFMFPENDNPEVPIPVSPVSAFLAPDDVLFGETDAPKQDTKGRVSRAGIRWVPNPRVQECKQVCAGCPVRDECLSWALATDQEHGVWGGKTRLERQAMKRKHYRHTPQAEVLEGVAS